VQVRDGEVSLALMAKGRVGLDLELWAVEKEKNYFRQTFGRELVPAAA
jgi:hypothetical protein